MCSTAGCCTLEALQLGSAPGGAEPVEEVYLKKEIEKKEKKRKEYLCLLIGNGFY
jgi:hypothetical protein